MLRRTLEKKKNKEIIDSFYRLLNLDCGMLLLPINLFCRRFTMQHGVKIVQPADVFFFLIRGGRYVYHHTIHSLCIDISPAPHL